MPLILLVEDEKDIAEALEYNLKKEGFQTTQAQDGGAALKIARNKIPDLIILDLMLPIMDGIEVCKILKHDPKTTNIPIIMLTAKNGEIDRVLGLELGADDYITKPFSMRELLARVKTVLKRYVQSSAATAGQNNRLKFPDLEIDLPQHKALVDGKEIELTAKEFSLLKFLAENKQRVYDREQLLDAVWGIDVAIETRTVDVHVRRVRGKLGKAGRHIITLRGVGYKFV
ncbi:MAG: response regulator transcription factor [Candidatus Margulisiibacteriota bacterium]